MERSLNDSFEEYKAKRFYDIEENLKRIRDNICEAAVKSGRAEDAVHLMAVTKTVEPVFINHAIREGIDLIGENRVQELMSKKPELELDGVDVHLIGHLQTNKVKQVVGEVSTIQSVDSIKVAREIGKQSEVLGITTKVLLEVNIGEEESKSGFTYDSVTDFCYEISEFSGISVEGLMAIPPICENSVELRRFFYDMRKLFVDIEGKKIDNICMHILSMGMSSDYVDAILEGSNLVRVGSSIFGARVY